MSGFACRPSKIALVRAAPKGVLGKGIPVMKCHNSRATKRDKLNGTNRAEFAVFRRFSLIFADFRFSWELSHFGGADLRRKPQIFAENRRFSQKPVCPISSAPFDSALITVK